MAISPEHARGKLGATIPAKDVSGAQAFGVELVASFLLVLTMLASIEANKDAARKDYGTAAALGVVVTLCYLIAVGIAWSLLAEKNKVKIVSFSGKTFQRLVYSTS